MRNSRHAFARRRRTPIDGTVTRYRRTPIGDQRIDTGTVHKQPEPTRAERDQAIAKGAIAVNASSWDQDN